MRRWAIGIIALAISGCSGSNGGGTDGGDARVSDAAPGDSAMPSDGNPADAEPDAIATDDSSVTDSSMDVSANDGSSTDAGALDGSRSDGGSIDTGVIADSGPVPDGSNRDVTMTVDTGLRDVPTPTDSGTVTDSGPRDTGTVADSGGVDSSAGCAFTVTFLQPTGTAMPIETCTSAGIAAYYPFRARVAGGTPTQVEFDWITPSGTQTLETFRLGGTPRMNGVTFNSGGNYYEAERKVGGLALTDAGFSQPLAGYGGQNNTTTGTWTLRVTVSAGERCEVTATQEFRLQFTSRNCPNP